MTSPDVLAQLDQLEAGIGEHVDDLIETIHRLSETRDPAQAGADVAAMLNRWPIEDVAAVAAVALLRLARSTP